jgi:hypothetical protein
MKSKSFSTTKKTAFEVCKRTLYDLDCDIISTDLSSGTIEAKKGGGLLSYGHKIRIVVKTIETGKIKISVSSNSVGVQIIDWGTNSENEDELIELITNSLR